MMNSVLLTSPMVSPVIRQYVTRLLPVLDDSILLMNIVLTSLVKCNGFNHKEALFIAEELSTNLAQSYVDKYVELFSISDSRARQSIANDFASAFRHISIYMLNDFVLKPYITKAHLTSSNLVITSVCDSATPTMVMRVL